ncbi:MAG: ATP-binding protein, partial [Gemmatimonadales bacterium]
RIDGLLVADWPDSTDVTPADAWIGSILAAPIRRVDSVLGTITVADEVPGRFSEHDRAALLRYGLHAAAALTGARLGREEARRSEENRQAAVATEALRRSEERHRSLIANAVEAIFTLDRRGVITSANEATARLWQLGPGRAVDEHWRTIPLFAQVDEAERQIERTFAGESRAFETEVAQRDGQRRLLAVSFSPILEDGRPAAVLGIARDITDWRRVQAQLLQVEKMAAIGQLVGGMAHEINNPLFSISVNLDLLIDEARTPEQLEALRAAKSEAQRATTIVRSLLMYLRGQGSERTMVDLREIVRGVTALRRYQLLNQQIELSSDAGSLAVPVRGNTVNLQQVLMNLIANAEHAIRHGPGHGHIWIRVVPLGDRVRLTVEDDGPGVPPELLTRVFDPFFTTKPEGEGTGLGLSVSAGIVADHLGRLSAEPRPGGGACFIMELPLSTSTLPTPPRVTPAEGTEAPGVGKKRILVVDDEPSIRRSVAKLLSREGWEVQLAESGDEGLQRVAVLEFDAVLCDLRMPGMSGHEFFRQLQVLGSPLEHRLVFMT